MRREPDDPLDGTCQGMSSFVIAIDGWSKKAVYMERHTSSDEAMARKDAIDADGTQDTAFVVEKGEETFCLLSRSPHKLLPALVARPLIPQLLFAIALTACGGGQESAAPPPPITRQALAAMVPRASAFPSEVRNLAPTDTAVSRGYVTSAQASEKTPDPTDSGPDLARLGRTGGYHNVVSTYTFVQTLAWAEASVDAFQREDEAQRFLDAQFVDLREQEGREDPTKGKIINIEEASVSAALGPATGVRYDWVAGPDRLWEALVAFRVGRVVGWSIVARVDELDPMPIADALAQTLKRRVERVGS